MREIPDQYKIPNLRVGSDVPLNTAFTSGSIFSSLSSGGLGDVVPHAIEAIYRNPNLLVHIYEVDWYSQTYYDSLKFNDALTLILQIFKKILDSYFDHGGDDKLYYPGLNSMYYMAECWVLEGTGFTEKPQYSSTLFYYLSSICIMYAGTHIRQGATSHHLTKIANAMIRDMEMLLECYEYLHPKLRKVINPYLLQSDTPKLLRNKIKRDKILNNE